MQSTIAMSARRAVASTIASPSMPLAVSVVRSVPVIRRWFHGASAQLNTINQTGAARLAGPTRTAKYISKRMLDRAREAEAKENLPNAFESNEAFLAAVDAMHASLYKGLRDMLAVNGDMRFEQSDDHRLEISLGPAVGSFTLTPEVETQRLVLFTPISAASYRYHYDTVNSRWVADSDSHILEEMFVREIISPQTNLKGFPQL